MNETVNKCNYRYDIFISYSSKDKKIVIPIVYKLKEAGYRIWRDEDILSKFGGDKYSHLITEGIVQSAIVLYIHSENSLQSEYVQDKELPHAINNHKKILPYRCDETAGEFKYDYLKSIQAVALLNNPETQKIDRLFSVLTAVRRVFGDLSPLGKYTKLETCGEMWSPEQIECRMTDEIFVLPIPESKREMLGKHNFYSLPHPEKSAMRGKLYTFLSTCDKVKDAEELIEETSNEVADYMLQRIEAHKTIFNGPMVGVSSITAKRSPDGKEVHSLAMEMYTSDYFTFKVVSGIYKKLKNPNETIPFNIRTIGDIPQYSPFLCSLGMGGFLMLKMGGDRRALWIRRSLECEAGGLYHFSYDETVAVKDVDMETKVVDVYGTLYRGIKEELGLAEKDLTGEGGIFEIGIILTEERIELELLSYQVLKSEVYPNFMAKLEAAEDSKLEVGEHFFWGMDEHRRELADKYLTPEAFALIQRLEVCGF